MSAPVVHRSLGSPFDFTVCVKLLHNRKSGDSRQPWPSRCTQVASVFSRLCLCVCESNVQPTESIKEIMKMCVTLLTVVQRCSSEYYVCHYQIAKATWQATHQPTQTHSKQHLIPSLTAHHPLGGRWATANGLSPIRKVPSQMSRKYYTYKICQILTKQHALERLGQTQMSLLVKNQQHKINRRERFERQYLNIMATKQLNNARRRDE